MNSGTGASPVTVPQAPPPAETWMEAKRMMTITELHSNEELRRHEFPVATGKVFLGHAGVCPLPRRVAEAIAHYTFNATQGDQEALLPLFRIQETRELAARILNAQ